jgi:RNA polymerase sigma-70 factor (ECF subfamily)
MQQLQIELIRGAQQGNRQCLEQLARQAKGCLEVYVYRLTQQHELSQEIVQESLLEMFKVIGKLREPDHFWPWLYGIATNKLRRHYKKEQARRKVAMSSITGKLSPNQRQSGFENLVGEELKQIVSRAMNKLKTRYKAVLIMRCYDDMSYSEIAESLGSSEFGTRMLFMRGKRALQKELSRNGFGARQYKVSFGKETDTLAKAAV